MKQTHGQKRHEERVTPYSYRKNKEGQERKGVKWRNLFLIVLD